MQPPIVGIRLLLDDLLNILIAPEVFPYVAGVIDADISDDERIKQIAEIEAMSPSQRKDKIWYSKKMNDMLKFEPSWLFTTKVPNPALRETMVMNVDGSPRTYVVGLFCKGRIIEGKGLDYSYVLKFSPQTIEDIQNLIAFFDLPSTTEMEFIMDRDTVNNSSLKVHNCSIEHLVREMHLGHIRTDSSVVNGLAEKCRLGGAKETYKKIVAEMTSSPVNIVVDSTIFVDSFHEAESEDEKIKLLRRVSDLGLKGQILFHPSEPVTELSLFGVQIAIPNEDFLEYLASRNKMDELGLSYFGGKKISKSYVAIKTLRFLKKTVWYSNGTDYWFEC